MSLKHPSVRSSRETEPIGGRKHTDRSKRRKVYFKESTHMILERLAKAKSAKEADRLETQGGSAFSGELGLFSFKIFN